MHGLSVEMLRELVASQLAAGAENRARRDDLEVARLLLEKKVGRDAVELVERAERERKLQAEVFRLGEKLFAVARQVSKKVVRLTRHPGTMYYYVLLRTCDSYLPVFFLLTYLLTCCTVGGGPRRQERRAGGAA